VTNRDGVDVSAWQGAPGDWKAAAGDIGWAGVKLTELGADGSRYVNPDAAADWDWLKAQGKKRIAYAFCHPAASAAQTASLFTGVLRGMGLADDDMIAIDLEVNDGKTPAEVASWACDVEAFLEHDLDRVALTYTFLDFAEAGNCAGLGWTPLWIADPSSPAGHPRIPAPWKHHAIHQYEITGAIDRDITAYESAAHMAAALGKQGTATHAKPAKPKKHTVKKTVGKGKTVVKKEPVLTAGTLAALLTGLLAALQSSKGIHLTAAEMQTALAVIVALAGLGATAATKPRTVGAAVTALATGATVLATTVAHLSPVMTGAQIPAAALLVALLARLHLSPATDPEA
jgi:Glycosyl hydrolases family 25